MEYQVRAAIPTEIPDIVRGYLECAEWSGLIEEDQKEALELSVSPTWTEAALREASGVCFDFKAWAIVAGFWQEFEADESRAGHDLWLTRNRHGAGFWDGDWSEAAGREATKEAHTFGERSVRFDDGKETLEFE